MFFADHHDIFSDAIDVATIEPWKPEPLDNDQWPPDYRAVYAWRIQVLEQLRSNPAKLVGAKAYYRKNKMEFICHWCDTYNPRKNGIKWIPFVLFSRQAEYIQFLDELDRDQENGLVEKARDIGATWLSSAYSVACFLFNRDDATGWGSRKQDLVDKIGDPDSIFEKMRLLLRHLPEIWLPVGFKLGSHATYEKLINPENGSTVTGESGDNIGRGGRKRRYFKDESAHYERPEKIESALGDNTNVQIDISSVNGLGNVFHRRREAGVNWSPGITIEKGFTRVFIFDWHDHPEKTQEWYDIRKAKAVREGMQHVFAQEVDRNYSAAIQNTIIPYEWIQSSVDAHLKLNIPLVDQWGGALDVADEGMDRNALAVRQHIILRKLEEWGERDPGVTTRRMLASVRDRKKIIIQYDNIGVGAGVKTEYNRLIDDKIITDNNVKLVGWNAGAVVINPYDRLIPDDDESPLNKDFFGNFKAQAWWSIRSRFYKTWRAIKDGVIYSPDELISLDSSMVLLAQAMKELAQPTIAQSSGLRTIVDKKPPGTKSPNLADAIVMAYFPVPEPVVTLVGGYSL